MKTIIAIDPGKSGGIAARTEGSIFAEKMPSTEGDFINRLVEIATIEGAKQTEVWIEDIPVFINAIPASSAMKLGRNFGFLIGASQMLGCSVRLVRPQEWQKSFNFGTKGERTTSQWKGHLRAEAQRRYPHLKPTLATADALLILTHALSQQPK